MVDMRIILLLLLALTLSSCSVKLEADPIKVSGNVTHTVTIDYTGIMNYCKDQCKDEVDANACTVGCYDNVIQLLNHILIPVAGTP
jgi:hypothetical protein